MVVYAAAGLRERGQAYTLLAQGAKEYWGLERLPDLERGPGGKPFFSAQENRQFNLSHSGNYALCALDEKPVGADIQIVKDWRPRLIERVCDERERAWLERQADPGKGFALLWALKECRVKYEGRGIVGTGEMIRAIRVPLPEETGVPQQVDGLWFRTYVGENWAAAVCGETRPPEEILWRNFWK